MYNCKKYSGAIITEQDIHDLNMETTNYICISSDKKVSVNQITSDKLHDIDRSKFRNIEINFVAGNTRRSFLVLYDGSESTYNKKNIVYAKKFMSTINGDLCILLSCIQTKALHDAIINSIIEVNK